MFRVVIFRYRRYIFEKNINNIKHYLLCVGDNPTKIITSKRSDSIVTNCRQCFMNSREKSERRSSVNSALASRLFRDHEEKSFDIKSFGYHGYLTERFVVPVDLIIELFPLLSFSSDSLDSLLYIPFGCS